jgi:hypothetical protein
MWFVSQSRSRDLRPASSPCILALVCPPLPLPTLPDVAGSTPTSADFGDKAWSSVCVSAVKSLAQAASQAQSNTHLTHGSGNCGCTAKTGTGDWTAHWKGTSTTCTGDANYQLVCTGRPGVYVRSVGIQPITGMPATHPKVTQAICGETLSAGDPIPATGLWSKSGSTTAGASDCNTVVSGELFYAQNHPVGSSGNTGYQNQDAASFYMSARRAASAAAPRRPVAQPCAPHAAPRAQRSACPRLNRLRPSCVFASRADRPRLSMHARVRFTLGYAVMDTSKKVYLIIGLDQASPAVDNPANGRKIAMTFTSTGLTNLAAPPAVVVKDDDSEVQDWNEATGSTTATWKWATCCTDGAVIGPLPSSGFTLSISITSYSIPVRARSLSLTSPAWLL